MQNDYSSYTNSTKINVISVCVCVCVCADLGYTSDEKSGNHQQGSACIYLEDVEVYLVVQIVRSLNIQQKSSPTSSRRFFRLLCVIRNIETISRGSTCTLPV